MSERDVAITFAGGGNRAFYQLGLMNRWFSKLSPRLGCLATCSAGAWVAALMLSGRKDEVHSYWRERSAEVKNNIEWRQLLAARHPLPHERIYREMLAHAFSSGGLERIRSQPFPVLVLTTAIPRRMPVVVALALAYGVYTLDDRGRDERNHSSYAQRAGFSARVFDARACNTKEELADLIIASSATPPFTAVGNFAGERLLDGGIIDPAPAFVANEVKNISRNLVMLTKPRPPELLGRQDGRLYIAPREPLPARSWDFAQPQLLAETIAIGERDAERNEPLLEEFLK
jgi:predicted acylesterase/phospholipase RssA